MFPNRFLIATFYLTLFCSFFLGSYLAYCSAPLMMLTGQTLLCGPFLFVHPDLTHQVTTKKRRGRSTSARKAKATKRKTKRRGRKRRDTRKNTSPRSPHLIVLPLPQALTDRHCICVCLCVKSHTLQHTPTLLCDLDHFKTSSQVCDLSQANNILTFRLFSM